jgi:dTDP-4-dehydrorhamnose reductase
VTDRADPARKALLITGAFGQLGSDVRVKAAESGLSATAFGSRDLDITDPDAVNTVLDDFARSHPGGVVINCAAYTAVDNAESDQDTAYAVNAAGPTHLAQAAVRHGLGLIHVSTDYVFPGDASEPYQIGDPTGPRSIYGASKLAGESGVRSTHPDAHVVRTAWVYGATGPNFVKTMAKLEASKPTVDVVDDQIGSPTWSAELAAGLVELAESSVPGGVLHATNTGETSWFGFAQEIFRLLGADPERVRPTTSAAFVRPAPRPAYSVLSPQTWIDAGLQPLSSWQDALAAAFAAHRTQFVAG